jgi:hypothetical protein
MATPMETEVALLPPATCPAIEAAPTKLSIEERSKAWTRAVSAVMSPAPEPEIYAAASDAMRLRAKLPDPPTDTPPLPTPIATAPASTVAAMRCSVRASMTIAAASPTLLRMLLLSICADVSDPSRARPTCFHAWVLA